jgi:hypothetical protein
MRTIPLQADHRRGVHLGEHGLSLSYGEVEVNKGYRSFREKEWTPFLGKMDSWGKVYSEQDLESDVQSSLTPFPA